MNTPALCCVEPLLPKQSSLFMWPYEINLKWNCVLLMSAATIKITACLSLLPTRCPDTSMHLSRCVCINAGRAHQLTAVNIKQLPLKSLEHQSGMRHFKLKKQIMWRLPCNSLWWVHMRKEPPVVWSNIISVAQQLHKYLSLVAAYSWVNRSSQQSRTEGYYCVNECLMFAQRKIELNFAT